jgi:archaellum component FlaC
MLPLIAPLISAIPVSAQVAPLEVTSFVVTPGGELGFILNRTVLIAGHPVQGAPVLYFWASKNPDTSLTGDEFLLATLSVGTATGVVFGTLLVNETIGAWLGDGEASIYLKVTSARATGSAAVVSDAFRLIVDPAIRERVLKVLDAYPDRPMQDFARYRYFFGRSDNPEFVLNLSAIEIGLGVNRTLERADVVNFTLIKLTQELYAYGTRPPVIMHSNFLVATVYGRQAIDITRGHNVVRLNGTIRDDFPLLFPTDLTIVNGTTIAYQAFNLIAIVKNGSTVISGVTWAKIDKSRIVGTGTATVRFNHTVASIGWTRTVNIYPTVRSIFYPGIVGRSGILEVGDNVTTLELRNFRPGIYTARIAFFARQPDFTYVKLPVEVSQSISVPATGSVTLTNITIPDNPYGGRFILVTVNVSAGWALAGPIERIYPIIWDLRGFNNDGSLAGATFAPGEYIFILGRGFLVATPVIDLVNVTTGVRIPLTVEAFAGVFGNGSFGAIVQIPPRTVLYHGNAVILRAYTDAFNNATSPYTGTHTVALGSIVRVFIEPRPGITRILPTPIAGIGLGATRYPFPADWEPLADRRFTLLVYGALATALRFNVSIREPITGLSFSIALNVPRTGVGSLLATFDVPEAPFGSYQVRVATIGVFTQDSAPAEQRRLNVTATVAAFDPARGRFDRRVFLEVPVNLTIRGHGFEAGGALKFDVPVLGIFNVPLTAGPKDNPVQAVAGANGRFEGWINLPTIITIHGTYIIRLHQSPAEATIIITIGVPPPFTVKIVTGAAKFADLPLDIWVLAFYGGSIAQEDQVVSVRVSVYLRVGDTTSTSTVTPVVAVPGQAVYYARFNAAEEFKPADVRGRDLLVVATAKGKFSPIALEDAAVDVTSVTIPPVMLEDLMTAISERIEEFDKVVRQLKSNLSKLDTLSQALGSLGGNVSLILGSLGSLDKALKGNVSLILGSLGGNVSLILGSLGGNVSHIKDLLDKVNTTVLLVGDDVKANLSRRLDRINTTLIGISGNVTEIMKLVREANLSISRVVVDEAGRVVAELRSSEGRIVGAIVANATALSDLIRAVRSDIADVRALLVEVNTNVGLVGQAVLVVGDDVRAVLSRLDRINGTLKGISDGVAEITTDVRGLAKLVREANLSISRVVVDEAGRVVAELRSSEGRIVGAISANAATLSDLIRTVETRVRGDVRGLSDALAAFQSEAFSRLDAVAGGVDTVRSDLARLRTDAAAMAGVVAGIQATVSRVDTNVGGLVETVRTISTTVDSVNRAVPGLATKADVSGAQAAITGAVDRAKSDIESAVKDAGGAAAASSRNWGIINAILIIIAIAILAYTTFVARRP